MKILAAVVTHNRSKLLLRCIESLRKQTFQTDEILVINNGSTDNTKEILSINNVKHINQDNLGSAGGWNTAINFGLSNNFDYIWLMDDDGFPDKESLKNLVNALDDSISCLSSIVVSEDDDTKLVFGFPKVDKDGIPRLNSFWKKIYEVNGLVPNKNGLIEYAHLFNGALISISHIRKIGNVNTQYFMYGDEVDYYFRLRLSGKVMSCIKSKHYHPNVFLREYSLMRIYYNIKNNLINYQKYHNYIYLKKILGPAVILLRILKTNGLMFVLSLIFGRNAKVFYTAIYRGFKNQIGHDYFE